MTELIMNENYSNKYEPQASDPEESMEGGTVNQSDSENDIFKEEENEIVDNELVLGEPFSRLICPICNEIALNTEGFFQHTKKHNFQNLASCNLCTEGFKSKKSLKIHIQTHSVHGIEKNISILNLIHTNLPLKRTENDDDDGDISYPCPKCRRSFDSEEKLNHHLENHPEKTIVCVLCEQKFSTDYLLTRHIEKEHKGNQPFHCIYCWQDHPNLLALKSHLNSHRDEINLYCGICDRQFPYRSDYNRHIGSHFKPDEFANVCNLCDRNFQSEEKLKKHAALHEGLDPLCCITCREQFSSKSELKAHMSEEHKTVPICSICKKEFKIKADLRRHMQIHRLQATEDDETACPVCLKDCLTQSRLQRHLKSHKSERVSTPFFSKFKIHNKPPPSASEKMISSPQIPNPKKTKLFVCENCDKVFNNKKALRVHMNRMHMDNEFKLHQFNCETCGTPYATQRGLNLHMFKHTGVYQCDICPEKFTVKEDYRKHINQHRENRIYVCEICGEECKNAGSLVLHQIVHSDTKPYQCKLCERSFKRAYQLRSHMLSHDSNRSFRCKDCPITTTSQEKLDKHIERCHVNERQFVCRMCQKTFAGKQSLLQHEKIHRTRKVHVCLICKKDFKTPQSLYQHHKVHNLFNCNHCEANFREMRQLRLHIKDFHREKVSTLFPLKEEKKATENVPQNQKNFCKLCNKGFSSPQGIYQHRRSYHKDNAHRCDGCGKEFGMVRAYKKHIRDCPKLVLNDVIPQKTESRRTRAQSSENFITQFKQAIKDIDKDSEHSEDEGEIENEEKVTNEEQDRPDEGEIERHKESELESNSSVKSIPNTNYSTETDSLIKDQQKETMFEEDQDLSDEIMERVQQLLTSQVLQNENEEKNKEENLNREQFSNLLSNDMVYFNTDEKSDSNDEIKGQIDDCHKNSIETKNQQADECPNINEKNKHFYWSGSQGGISFPLN